MTNFHYEPPETLKKISEIMKAQSEKNEAWFQPVEDAIYRYDSLFRPIYEISRRLDDRIKQITTKIEIPDSLLAIEKMKSSQYVFWDYLSKPFVAAVINDCDTAIDEYESDDDYAQSEELIGKCMVHSYLADYQHLYVQTIAAYHLGLFNLAAAGLTAIIDAVMSESTQNPTHKSKERYEAILDKLMAEEFVADKEYATLALFMTFNATALSFYKSIPFSEEEPDFLNRNWIMHGRTKTELTRIDCIKLIRFLYGIILIAYIDEQGVLQS